MYNLGGEGSGDKGATIKIFGSNKIAIRAGIYEEFIFSSLLRTILYV